MQRRLRHFWLTYRRSVAVAGLCLVVLLVAGAYKVRYDYVGLPPLPEISDLPLSVVVLDRDDRLLRAFTSHDEKWRLPIELEDIDPLYVKMLLAFEDKRFFEHGGVDGRAFVRSALQSVRHGRIVAGGSTLTMQVARLLDEAPTKSLRRKYEQVLKAVQLEEAFSKEDILRLYVLRAPFGGNLEGVRAASLTWFGKEPRRLTAAEAALLVALPQSPEARRPDRFPENARKARDRVLMRAEAAGVISQDEAAASAAEPVRTKRFAMPLIAAHESRDALSKHPERNVHRLTLNRDLQSTLESIAKKRVAEFPAPISLSVVVADHGSGEILASIGAPDLLDETRLGHVNMTRAVRSPGSTLKPLIYGLAFEEGIGVPESLIIDRPTNIGGYRPTNFDQAYQGTVTLREALQLSLNTPAVQLLEAVGPARLIARLKRTGVQPALEKGKSIGLAISLGGLGLSLKDLAQAYGAVARGGAPVVLRSCRSDCAPEAGGPQATPILTAKASALVSDILIGMPQINSAETQHIAYKTGTSYGYRDAWAVGYDGRHVAAVWVGRPDGSPVPGQTGAKAAVPVLFSVFQSLGLNRAPLPAYPAEAQSALEGDVPQSLEFARIPQRIERRIANNALEIAYPPNGAELDLGLSNDSGGFQLAQPLVVKFKGGTAPFSILVNGAPLPATGQSGRQLVWQPDAPGFADVTIVDASGKSAAVTVLMR